MTIKVISLLNDRIEYAILEKGNVEDIFALPSFIWKNDHFDIDEPVDDDLVFDKIHLKFDMDFEYTIKLEFLRCFIEEMFPENSDSNSGTAIVLLPTHFPEWAIQEFKSICRGKGIRQIILIRAAFLSVISQYLADINLINALDYKPAVNSKSKKNENHWTLTHTGDEQPQLDEVLNLLEIYFQNVKEPWPTEWPIELGIFDSSKHWHTLADYHQPTPYQRYFFFEMEGLQEASPFILLAKTKNDFIVEILRVELPENEMISPARYNLKLDFQYGWNGEMTLNKGITALKRIPVYLPFLTYHI